MSEVCRRSVGGVSEMSEVSLERGLSVLAPGGRAVELGKLRAEASKHLEASRSERFLSGVVGPSGAALPQRPALRHHATSTQVKLHLHSAILDCAREPLRDILTRSPKRGSALRLCSFTPSPFESKIGECEVVSRATSWEVEGCWTPAPRRRGPPWPASCGPSPRPSLRISTQNRSM